jgi:hypothetical protein
MRDSDEARPKIDDDVPACAVPLVFGLELQGDR